MLGGLRNGYHCKAGCGMSSFTVHCHMAWDLGGFPCNEKHLGTPVTEQHLLKNHIYDPCVNGVFTYSQPVTVDLRPYLAVLLQPSHMPTALLKPISFTGQTIRDRRLQNNSYSTIPGKNNNDLSPNNQDVTQRKQRAMLDAYVVIKLTHIGQTPTQSLNQSHNM